jgi:hypothetical protein
MERDELSVVRLFRREQPSRISDTVLAPRLAASPTRTLLLSSTRPIEPNLSSLLVADSHLRCRFGRVRVLAQLGRKDDSPSPGSAGESRRQGATRGGSILQFGKLLVLPNSPQSFPLDGAQCTGADGICPRPAWKERRLTESWQRR